MEIAGQERIGAPCGLVWQALNDPAVLRRCLPGCEALELRSPTELAATLALAIGPVSARFDGTLRLSQLEPPDRPGAYRLTAEGRAGSAGFARGEAAVNLLEAGPGATLLEYSGRAQLGGRLAQVGQRLLEATARRLAGEFFGRFGAIVEAQAARAAG